jgi:hypothetical protein
MLLAVVAAKRGHFGGHLEGWQVQATRARTCHLRLTLTRAGSRSPNDEHRSKPLPRLVGSADPRPRSHSPLGCRLESHRHVEECAQQPTRLVHLHRCLQYCWHPAHHLPGVVSEGSQPALILVSRATKALSCGCCGPTIGSMKTLCH